MAVAQELPHQVGRRRRRRRVRAYTIPVKRLTKEQLRLGRRLYPETDYWKPRTREDCQSLERPCPYLSCPHHLYLDVSPTTGSIKLNFPDLEPWELTESCALDVADRGGITLEEIGEIMNLTRERIRQVELKGLASLRRKCLAEGLTLETSGLLELEAARDSVAASRPEAEDSGIEGMAAAVQRAYERIVPADQQGKRASKAALSRGHLPPDPRPSSSAPSPRPVTVVRPPMASRAVVSLPLSLASLADRLGARVEELPEATEPEVAQCCLARCIVEVTEGLRILAAPKGGDET